MIIFDWIEDNLDFQAVGAFVSVVTIIGCVVLAYFTR